ncbi:hypothetical protein GLW20_17635 [Virgibacillus halodenitrificans]|nr:hypothetical protein [Virgibacillus halodenitrificans]
MLKKGKYALYKGAEYRFLKKDNQHVELISNNSSDMKKGFSHYEDDVYTKVVSKHDLEKTYHITPRAKYKGELFYASNGDGDGTISLDTDKATIAKKYNFERTDKYMYSKYVNIEEVEIIEEKEVYNL